MEPQEKAQELIVRFRKELSWLEKGYKVDLWRDAKQCAAICVQEIIASSDHAGGWDIYWNEVLTHLK